MSGRRIHVPKSLKARPTTDMARESLFNILMNKIDFDDIMVLDLFAGTGAISYEFASLGTPHIFAVDNNYKQVTAIQKNCEDLNVNSIIPLKADAFRYISSCRQQFDLIFADPPYDLTNFDTIPGLIKEAGILKENGLFILEHGPTRKFSNIEGWTETRKYGKVNFSFFSF